MNRPDRPQTRPLAPVELRRQLIHGWDRIALDPRRDSFQRYLQLLQWKAPKVLEDDPASSYAVPDKVRKDPRTRALIRELQALCDGIAANGWNRPITLRITLAQFLRRYERPDGRLDLQRGRATFGPAFDELLRSIRCAPMQEGLLESELLTGLPARELAFQPSLSGWGQYQAAQDRYERTSGDEQVEARNQVLAIFATEVCEAFPQELRSQLEAFRKPPTEAPWPPGLRVVPSPAESTPPPLDALSECWRDLRQWDVLPHFEDLIRGNGAFAHAPKLAATLARRVATIGLADDDERIRLALGEVIAGHTRRGQPDWPALMIEYPGFDRVLGQLSSQSLPHPAPPVDDFQLRLWAPKLAQRLQRHLAREPQMPLVESTVASAGNEAPLSDCEVLVRTHVLQSTAGMLSALGCDPTRTLVLGKAHSTHIPTADRLSTLGYTVYDLAAPHGMPGVSTESMERMRQRWLERRDQYDAYLRHFHRQQLNGFRPAHEWVEEWRKARTGEAPVHVIDDGAELLLELARHPLPPGQRVTAVEQTRFGIWALEGMELPFAVVAAGDSPAKIYLEGALVGWSIVAEMQALMKELASSGIPPGKRVVVCGNGAVGGPTAKLLHALGFEVAVLEKDDLRLEEAQRDGLRAAKVSDAFMSGAEGPSPEVRHLLANADYVIGATGKRAVPDLSFLKDGAVLLSASSSTIEFAVDSEEVGVEPLVEAQARTGVAFRDRFVSLSGVGSRVNVLRLPDKDLLLANRGHPVNLNGHPDPIAARYIQLTRALLTLATIQARGLDEGVTGLVPLDARGELEIAEHWMAQLREDPDVPPEVMTLLEEAYVKVLAALSPRAGEASSTRPGEA